MRTRAIPWVREDSLDCHPDPNLRFSAVCAGMGLTATDCFNCPFPVCLDDIPAMQGAGIRNGLNNHLPGWRAKANQLPPEHRNEWLIEKVRAWLFREGLGKSRDVLNWPGNRRADLIDECRTFVRLMERQC